MSVMAAGIPFVFSGIRSEELQVAFRFQQFRIQDAAAGSSPHRVM